MSFLRLMALILVFISPAVADDNISCQWPVDVSLGGVLPNQEPFVTRYQFNQTNDVNLISITETTLITATDLQLAFPSKVTSSPGWADLQSRQSCQLHIGDTSLSLNPQPPFAAATVNMNVEKWWCTSDDEWCPTTGEPARTCRKERSGKVAGANIKSTVLISLTHDADNVREVSSAPDTQVSTSWEQRVVIDLLGNALGGVTGAFATNYIQDQILGRIGALVNANLREEAPPLDNPPSDSGTPLPGYDPIVSGASFVDLGDGRLGISIVRVQAETQDGQACYMASGLQKESERRSREFNDAVQRALDLARANACAPYKFVGWHCPF